MTPKKSLGQHFLRCRWVVSTLIKAANLKPADTVLEIGPGTGILTRELAKNAGKVIAVEKDETLAALLTNELTSKRITNVAVVPNDILKVLPALAANYKLQTTNYKFVANIPYYLTSRLLRLLLEGSNTPELMVLTIQKEVAQRIVAKPPKMNLLALSVQTFGRPKIVKTIPASCFWPKPKVDSAVIKISDINADFFKKNGLSKEFFFEIARRAFSQKRKMLTSSLRSYFGQHPVLAKAGLPDKARPQELGLEQWAKLVRELSTEARKNI